MDTRQEKDIIRTLVKAGHESLAKTFARSRGYGVKTTAALRMTPKLREALIGTVRSYVGKDMQNLTIGQVWVLPSNIIRFQMSGPYIIAKRAAQKLSTKQASSKGFSTKLLKNADEGAITLDIQVTPELERAADML